MKIALFTLLLLLIFLGGAVAQNEPVTSRLYFPGLIGIGIPSGDDQTSMQSGFSLNTAVEYRPIYADAVFFRFNYDNISSHYNNLAQPIPTNINHGKLSANFFLLGAGYRQKIDRLGVYFVAQPGYSNSVYDLVYSNASGFALSNTNSDHFSAKATMGVEYYIVPHFALVLEPSYYHIFKTSRGFVLNPNYVCYSVGFTTTLFQLQGPHN